MSAKVSAGHVAVLVCCAGAFAGTEKGRHGFRVVCSKKLHKDEQVLHALDRLTFGPRPGDVAAVKKLGVKKWIELQLHPEQIKENPELERSLQPLESLRMSQAMTAASYPPPQLIRAGGAGASAFARGSDCARGGGTPGAAVQIQKRWKRTTMRWSRRFR